jgi:endonuclease/exonuclease/phosphatase family metal-dependent hydrolase
MKVVFANVTHGFVYADDLEKPEGMVFRKFSIPDYVEYFRKLNPDILCLSEALIDDEDGNSEFVDVIAKATKLNHTKVLRSEESWIYVGKHYGMAILSRYPITSYGDFKLPNPKFEVTRPNGDHWILHDKYAQFAELDINGEKLNLFNLHYFPVHHFDKKIQSEKMKPYRKALSEFFTSKGFDRSTIITGDFNDKGSTLQEVFPELFESGDLKEAIEVETTIQDGNDQLDHILYTHDTLQLNEAKAEKFLSDHYSLVVQFE